MRDASYVPGVSVAASDAWIQRRHWASWRWNSPFWLDNSRLVTGAEVAESALVVVVAMVESKLE
jgi:hypothetical protein